MGRTKGSKNKVSKPPKKNVTIRLTYDECNALLNAATAKNITMSKMVRELIYESALLVWDKNMTV